MSNRRKPKPIKESPRTMLKRRVLEAKTCNQQLLIDKINSNTLTICCGPSGTGKTTCSVSMALEALLSERVDKVLIARPVVESGEKLGFLPGSLNDKLAPYLVPVFDEMRQVLTPEEMAIFRSESIKKIEVVPLAMCRGRNFKHSFVILDEAQNATFEQLEMFITRLAEGSTMIINGDPNQSDLPPRDRGALSCFSQWLGHIDGVGVVQLESKDIVRHPLVEKIVNCLADKKYV